MPDNYANARWLTPREREVARDRVRDNQTVSTDNRWKWSQFWEALRDPQTIFFFVTAVWAICVSVIHLDTALTILHTVATPCPQHLPVKLVSLFQVISHVKLTTSLVFESNCTGFWFHSLANDSYFRVSGCSHSACYFSYFLLYCVSSQQHPTSSFHFSIHTALDRRIFTSCPPWKQPSWSSRRLLSYLYVSTAAQPLQFTYINVWLGTQCPLLLVPD